MVNADATNVRGTSQITLVNEKFRFGLRCNL